MRDEPWGALKGTERLYFLKILRDFFRGTSYGSYRETALKMALGPSIGSGRKAVNGIFFTKKGTIRDYKGL